MKETTPPPPPPLAAMPAAWVAVTSRHDAASPEPAPVQYLPEHSIDLGTLRERLKATCKNKRGEAWDALRRGAEGERMIQIQGGPALPPPGAKGQRNPPLIVGVDEFVSKQMLWALAHETYTDAISGEAMEWHRVPPGDIAALFDPSFSHLRADALYATGVPSRFDAFHVAEKWARVAEKVQGEKQSSEAFLGRLLASSSEAAEARALGLPLIVQYDKAYFVLDDRDQAAVRYEGPMSAAGFPPLARQLWAPSGRVLDVENEKGELRPMIPAELIQAYGASVTRVEYEYAAPTPRVEDLTMVLPAIVAKDRVANQPDPKWDDDVDAWLRSLAAERYPDLVRWLYYADPSRCGTRVPCLTMVGGAHVGKTLLADSVARAAGQVAPGELSRALGRFRWILTRCPILFSDEGLPRGNGGQPLTEEFRALVTAQDHIIELKGVDGMVHVRGSARVMLAANRADRLFSNRGNLGSDDVTALLRRLLVIDTSDAAQASESARRSIALGAFEGDPARLARVAGHIRAIQTGALGEMQAPEPCAGNLARELRRGHDGAAVALAAIEDGLAQGADWIAIDTRPDPEHGALGGLLWYKGDALSIRAQTAPPALARNLAPYIRRPSTKLRKHPVTGETDPQRARWVGLDLDALRRDGIDVA